MIRAAIAGGDTPLAGEITKILINHPDVELRWSYAPEVDGGLVSKFHKGLRGETYMRFTTHPKMDEIDVLFLCFDEPELGADFLEKYPGDKNLRIVDATGDFRLESLDQNSEWVYGLPELNRKPMVRGARLASIPDSLSAIILLSLIPLAKNHMLNSTIHVNAVVHDDDAEPGETLALLEYETSEDIAEAIRELQPGFNSEMLFVVTAGGFRRGISTTIYLDIPESEEEIIALYDDYYSDHSFTFLSDSVPSITEVIGTNKCIINLQKVGKRLVITTAIDDMTKGGAGMAVHDMNLLFGLQERVGLMLIAHS